MSEDLMFDYRSFYDRIAEQMPDNCRVCEVGNADGHSAIYLGKKLKQLGKEFILYMVDNMDYGGMEQFKKIYENIINADLIQHVDVMPYDSVVAANKFNNHFLNFVFLDSSHLYENTKEEVKIWYDKLLDDGILAGHDYFGHEEVKKAVEELIPKEVIREPLAGHDPFEPEQLLFTEETERGFGIWYLRKRFYWKP